MPLEFFPYFWWISNENIVAKIKFSYIRQINHMIFEKLIFNDSRWLEIKKIDHERSFNGFEFTLQICKGDSSIEYSKYCFSKFPEVLAIT